jgi:hypothetical protein
MKLPWYRKPIKMLMIFLFNIMCVASVWYSAYIVAVQHFYLALPIVALSIWMTSTVPKLWKALDNKPIF